jgi:hypothetical protein
VLLFNAAGFPKSNLDVQVGILPAVTCTEFLDSGCEASTWGIEERRKHLYEWTCYYIPQTFWGKIITRRFKQVKNPKPPIFMHRLLNCINAHTDTQSITVEIFIRFHSIGPTELRSLELRSLEEPGGKKYEGFVKVEDSHAHLPRMPIGGESCLIYL